MRSKTVEEAKADGLRLLQSEIDELARKSDPLAQQLYSGRAHGALIALSCVGLLSNQEYLNWVDVINEANTKAAELVRQAQLEN